MTNLMQFIRRAFKPGPEAELLPAGVFHYQAPPDDPLNYRLHLRLETDGSGLLIINAATILHLNQTAAEIAYHLVNQTPFEEAVKLIQERYQASYAQVRDDFQALEEQIETLINSPDLDPVTYLDIDRHAPYSDSISAPYRLDCALTYRVPPSASPEVSPTKRVDRELDTAEWKRVIDTAWAAGIPHLLFTGGEPTLREDLPELLAYAEEKGQVTGLLTDGLRLGDASYLETLLNAGLDHTMITLQPDRENTWEALASFSYWANAMDEDLFVAVHLTLTHSNRDNFPALIEKLALAGISALSLSANDPQLTGDLQSAQELAYARNLELVWDIPVPYSRINPITLELAQAADSDERLSGAGRGWLYVEPDGDVLPGQGITEVLGNLLHSPWTEIWRAADRYWRANKPEA
jgi:hypothetical protein